MEAKRTTGKDYYVTFEYVSWYLEFRLRLRHSPRWYTKLSQQSFTSDDDDFPKGSVDTYKGEPWVEVEVECNMFEVSPTVHGKPESKKCNDHWVYSIFKNISRSW